MIRRPISPHLQIYKLPLAAVISISHRIIGAALFVGYIIVALYCSFVLLGINLQGVDELIFSWLGKFIITFLVTGLLFYILAEVRYIIWEFNCGLRHSFINVSNFLILIITVALSIVFWIMIW